MPAAVEATQTIEILDFVDEAQIEPPYFEKPYHILPGKKGEKGYVLLREAIKEAGELRFLPIVLTSLTAIGGLMPIALSSNPLVSPLALVLIGGLISSTILSRIVTPVVYKLIPPKIQIVG